MRERILEILRSKMPAPVSGEVLSQELAVSRTAIWKHIQALKNEGYTIESVPKKGYILKEVPDRLKPAEVVANLKTKWLGHHIHYCELTTSTNELAKRLAGEGCEDEISRCSFIALYSCALLTPARGVCHAAGFLRLPVEYGFRLS